MKMYIHEDELYPIYYLEESSYYSYPPNEFEEDFIEKYKQVMRTFWEIQGELEKLYNDDKK